MSFTYELIKSWADRKGNVSSMEQIMDWIQQRNDNLKVEISKIDFSYDGFWHYDSEDGYIRNKNNSFFQVAGYQEIIDDKIVAEQPIIIQNEIGYLGIICKMIDGRLNFLMQAKIEPGNVNVVQLSPTIQATKSNFTRQHGGKTPAYFDYFANAKKYHIVVDQLQSEQSSRFYKKRNRNIIICVDDEIEVLPSHMWMTLGQIKECMKIDNLVNMDTRTVISCLPFLKSLVEEDELEKIDMCFSDKTLEKSIFNEADYDTMHLIFNALNDEKMYGAENSRLLPLKSLKSWEMTDKEIVSKSVYDFKVVFCHIEIEGREVNYWEQPLLEANGKAVFGIFTTVDKGVRKFLVCVKHEFGCFDGAELGPTVQMEPTNPRNIMNNVEKLFFEKLNTNQGIKCNVILSEEGGRFYHEENQNVIIDIDKSELDYLPDGYFWVDFATINGIIQFNNCVNIQLRNLMSLVDF